jgi:hypothetical protein
MPGYYEQRQSRAALWCARLASVSLPYFAIVILLHRLEKVTTPQGYWLVGFGLVLILFALFLGARAILDMWNHGYSGGRLTIRGLLIAIIMLLPFSWFGYLAMLHPSINDVSTNPYSPPGFIRAGNIRADQAAQGMNQLASYTPPYATLLIESYPKLASRRYNAGAERIYEAASALIADRGWGVTAVVGLPEADGVPVEGADGAAEAEPEARLETAAPLDIRVEAMARSLIFAFHYDVVLRIVSEDESTLVDMRVAARWGRHDFGASAKIIEKFLADLDASLLGIAGEG